MKSLLKSLVAGLLAVALTGPAAFAQNRPAFSQQELDQMLAPIALYPDALLSQLLMAATYPLEVVQAARWSRSNSHLQGEDAMRAVEPMDWDPSVKSLVAFPQILHEMDEKLDWTQRLGEAFIVQEPQVMETIQGLRQRAAAAGNLGPGEQMRVVRQGEHILIEPASPQVVYVPYYDPSVVYGPWWWPAYPPVYWAPWAGYYVGTGYGPAFIWGSGIVIRTGFFFGYFNWPHRHVYVDRHPAGRVVVNRQVTVIDRAHVRPDHRPVRWRHDPRHRRGVAYRHAAATRDEFRRSGASSSDARGDHRRLDAAPLTHERGGERTARFRDEHRGDNRNPGRARDERHTGHRQGTMPSNDPRVEGQRRAHVDRDTREPRLTGPTTTRDNGRPDSFGDSRRSRVQSLSRPPAPAMPATRVDTRPAGATPDGHDRHTRRSRSMSATATHNPGDGGRAGRPAAPVRAEPAVARPFASSGGYAPRAASGNHRLERRHGAERRFARPQN